MGTILDTPPPFLPRVLCLLPSHGYRRITRHLPTTTSSRDNPRWDTAQVKKAPFLQVVHTMFSVQPCHSLLVSRMVRLINLADSQNARHGKRSSNNLLHQLPRPNNPPLDRLDMVLRLLRTEAFHMETEVEKVGAGAIPSWTHNPKTQSNLMSFNLIKCLARFPTWRPDSSRSSIVLLSSISFHVRLVFALLFSSSLAIYIFTGWDGISIGIDSSFFTLLILLYPFVLPLSSLSLML